MNKVEDFGAGQETSRGTISIPHAMWSAGWRTLAAAIVASVAVCAPPAAGQSISTVSLTSSSGTAVTADQALLDLLGNSCQGIPSLSVDQIPPLGSDLLDICFTGGLTSSSGGTSVLIPPTISGFAILRAAAQRKKKPGGGSSGDSSGDLNAMLGGGLNLFVSGDIKNVDKDITTFENGFNSTGGGGNIGADLALSEQITVGLGARLGRTTGDFSGGGDFNTSSYGMFGYVSLLPFPGAFVDIAGSYTYNRYKTKRAIAFTTPGLSRSGDSAGETQGDEVGADVRTGYDFNFANITVGPRFGLSFARNKVDGYTETGTTGLEMNVFNQIRRSLQTRAGAYGSIALSRSFGVLVPYVSADYIHEFEDDQRTISATLVQDLSPVPTIIQFQTEPPDRNFFELGVGLSAVLENGLQPYAKFGATVGHSYLNTYSGNVGVRYAF